jgi:hypothetical protein
MFLMTQNSGWTLTEKIWFAVVMAVSFCGQRPALGEAAADPENRPILTLDSAALGDKSGYWLFNPTPRALMREMSTDRPDTTESPFTVDAGHFQVELSLLDFAYNHDNGERTETLSLMPVNLKVGLLNNVDLQFIFTPYVNERTKAVGTNQRRRGFSDDTQLRLKMNVWGNDGPSEIFGDTALAIMPFVKFPTGTGGLSNEHVEGGLILPLAVALPGDWNLGLMGEIDFVYNDASGSYGVDFVHTATVSHDVPGIENLAFYLEYIGIAPSETGSQYQAIGSAGLTYQMTSDWMLDFGGTVGLSESADDFTLFVGMSFRH